MAKGPDRDLVRERLWRSRLSAWKACGLSVRAFCRQQGLTEPTFHYWKRELRLRRGEDMASSVKRPSPKPKFVPVTVLPASNVSVEVRCPSGHVVSVPVNEVTTLYQLFAALSSLPVSSGEVSPC